MPQDRIPWNDASQEPKLIRLRADTRNFLQAYRNSDEFGYHYHGNLSLVGDLDHLSDIGKRNAIWSRAFVDRLFSIGTLQEADRLLEPWIRWAETHSRIWNQYWSGGGDQTKINARFKECEDQFKQVEIPSAIKQYQGNLQDMEVRSLANWEIFGLTRGIREAIDLIEGLPRSVSLETIFMVQRITNQPFFPVNGLEDHVTKKPDIKRIEKDGNFYITFFDPDYPSNVMYPDSTTEELWNRWKSVDLGKHIRYIIRDEKTGTATVGAGVVEGFDRFGAGDAMLFGPSVSLIGVVVRKDRTRFLDFTLLSNIRLDSEEIAKKDLWKRRT